MVKLSKFVCVTFLLSFVICFCISGTVFSQSFEGRKMENAYLHNMEVYFLEEVKAVLEQEHLYKSGITMTKTEEDGEMEYKVLIHNKRITGMTDSEQKALQKELKRLEFPDEKSQVLLEFLEL